MKVIGIEDLEIKHMATDVILHNVVKSTHWKKGSL
jgi:hypothetical protein